MSNVHDGDNVWEEFQGRAIRFEQIAVGQFFIHRLPQEPGEEVGVWYKTSAHRAHTVNLLTTREQEWVDSALGIVVADPAAAGHGYTVVQQGETDRYFTAVLNVDCLNAEALVAALGDSIEINCSLLTFPLSAGSLIQAAFKLL